MDKLAGLLGAAAALTTMTAAKAAPAVVPELPQVSSYRDLLDPIPNALTSVWYRTVARGPPKL